MHTIERVTKNGRVYNQQIPDNDNDILIVARKVTINTIKAMQETITSETGKWLDGLFYGACSIRIHADNTFTVDNHDVEDIFSTAILALYESATLPENERILFAYSRVNKYVKSLKNVRENTKISLEDLTAKIYSGLEQDITDREKLASMQFDINQFIKKTKDKLNDKQASIFGAMMKGETISDIAKKEGVNKSSVCRIMARVKAIICKDILPQYPCIDIVNINAVLGVMAKINSQRHTKK